MRQHGMQRWTNTHPNRGILYDPFAHAEDLGIQVLIRPITTANEMWLPDFETIVLKEGMHPAHQRAACAHGIAHAVLGHETDNPKHEALADRLASANLIAPTEFARLARASPDTYSLARELGVTVRLLLVYLETQRMAG